MPTKQKMNKTKAVADYLKTHPKAMSSEIAAALTKQGIKINPGHVANIKTKLKSRRRARAKLGMAATTATAAVAAPEAPVMPANVITLEQIKSIGQMVRAIGGFERLNEMVGVIKEVGGLKRFKDLLEAMSVTEQGGTKA
jgi:hypothetical protein